MFKRSIEVQPTINHIMSNNKRLQRDLQNKVLGGVCSGLGNYFDMDPTFWRILFFVLFLFGCSGLLIYVILWIAMPSAKFEPGAATPPQETSADDARKKKNSSMAAGLTLIGIGILCLLARYVPQINWHTAWPILLIVLGLILIIPFKSKES